MTHNDAVYSPSPVTFHVFRKDGSRNPDIKYSFIEIMSLSAQDAAEGYIVLSDKTTWAVVVEDAVRGMLMTTDAVKCIISFQARVNGNFAVARLFREDYRPKGRHA